MIGQVFRLVLNEQITREQAVPGVLGDDADRHPVGRIGTRITVLHVHVFHLQIGRHALVQGLEILLRDRFVDGAPPDLVVTVDLVDDELVVRRTTRVMPGADNQRSEV